MSAENTSIIDHTENSREGGILSNSQSTYTTPNSLAATDIIESNKAMFSALTGVLLKILTFLGTQLHENSKCQMEQINKLTEPVTQMSSSHNANKLAARSTADSQNSDNSDSWEVDEVNDRRNRVTIHEMDSSFYNETVLAAFFRLIKRCNHL